MEIDITAKIRITDPEQLVDMFNYFADLDVSQKGKLRLQGIWRHIKSRCYGKSTSQLVYQRNNIQVCQDWLYDFESFYNWAIDNGYSDDLTIDRINNDLNYQPGNCRWVSSMKNNRYKGIKTRFEIGY